MRIAFMGNHTTGVNVLKTMLRREENVVGVVAHPPDPEDGVCYESVYDFAKEHDLDVVRMRGKDPELQKYLHDRKPDLLWVSDYRYVLSPSIFTIPPLGAINLHGSLLPKYRGRAFNNWAIINGETTLGLTAHFIDEGVDTGDIIDQLSYEITDDDDAGAALEKLYPLFVKLTDRVLDHFHSGNVPRAPQDESEASEYPKRGPKDGIIDWSKSARDVRNLIRAVARPYPGAFTHNNGEKLIIWKARIEDEDDNSGEKPGTIIDTGPGQEVSIACGRGVIRAFEVSRDERPANFSKGETLASIEE